MMQPPRNDYLHPFHVHRAIRAPQGSLYSRHMSEPLRRGQHSEQLLHLPQLVFLFPAQHQHGARLAGLRPQ